MGKERLVVLTVFALMTLLGNCTSYAAGVSHVSTLRSMSNDDSPPSQTTEMKENLSIMTQGDSAVGKKAPELVQVGDAERLLLSNRLGQRTSNALLAGHENGYKYKSSKYKYKSDKYKKYKYKKDKYGYKYKKDKYYKKKYYDYDYDDYHYPKYIWVMKCVSSALPSLSNDVWCEFYNSETICTASNCKWDPSTLKCTDRVSENTQDVCARSTQSTCSSNLSCCFDNDSRQCKQGSMQSVRVLDSAAGYGYQISWVMLAFSLYMF